MLHRNVRVCSRPLHPDNSLERGHTPVVSNIADLER